MHRNLIQAILFVLLTACSSGTRVQKIEVPEVALSNVLNKQNDQLNFELKEEMPTDWWTLFEDEQLSLFISTALTKNPTLLAAQTRISEMAYTADQVKATLYPSLFWNGDISHQKLSKTGVIPLNQPSTPPGTLPPAGAPIQPGTKGTPVYFTQYETGLNLAFNFDIWGKRRNLLRAALGEIQAKIADEVFARLQLSTALAEVYFRLQLGYKRQEIVEAFVENKSKSYQLLQHRLKSNVSDALALTNAENDLVRARQSLLATQAQITLDTYQLKALLAGDFNEEIAPITVSKEIPRIPLPKDLPMRLIARRPDISSQLWIIKSAGHQIEAAKAGFYPDFNLIALAGFQTIHLSKLFLGKSSYFNIDPAFSLPLFTGGQLTANLRGSEVDYDLAVFKYNELVLNAVCEVLTQLEIVRNARQQFEEFKKMTEDQKKLLQLTQLRKAYNLESSFDTLKIEANWLLAQEQEIIALQSMYQAILGLIKAVGGGYDVSDLDEKMNYCKG